MNPWHAPHKHNPLPPEQQEGEGKEHVEKALDEFRAAGKALGKELRPRQLLKHHPKALLAVGGALGLLLARRFLGGRRKSDQPKSSPETIRHAVGRSLFASLAKAAGGAMATRLMWGLAHRGHGRQISDTPRRENGPF